MNELKLVDFEMCATFPSLYWHCFHIHFLAAFYQNLSENDGSQLFSHLHIQKHVKSDTVTKRLV